MLKTKTHHKSPHTTCAKVSRSAIKRSTNKRKFTTTTATETTPHTPYNLIAAPKTPLSQRQLPKKRVVVTGLGVVSPLGMDVKDVYHKILSGQTAIQNIDHPDLTKLKLQCKSYAPVGDILPQLGENIIPTNMRQILSRHQIYALAASHRALDQAGLLGKYNTIGSILDSTENADTTETTTKTPTKACKTTGELELCGLCEDQPECAYQRDETDRFGACIGSSIGCVEEIGAAHVKMEARGGKGVGAYSLPKLLVNLAAGHITQMHQARALTHTVSTACATGAHAIGDAFNFIKDNKADVIIAGGTETGVSPLSLALFNRIHALSRQDAETSGGPFTVQRDGFVMGEGSAVLVLESLEHAVARKANILCEVLGYGLSSDAYHITQPHILGRGAYMAMENALKDGGIDMSYVDYINAHATSTPIGDIAEATAVKALTQIQYGERKKKEKKNNDNDNNNNDGVDLKSKHNLFSRPIVSSTKGNVGHLLGAAGAFEAAMSITAITTNTTPPTILRSGTIDPAIPINITTYNPETQGVEYHFDNLAKEQQKDETQKSETSQQQGATSVDVVLSNSFGFGGTNACLIFGRYEAQGEKQ